jgi:MinD superfamily P-loop ATPase
VRRVCRVCRACRACCTDATLYLRPDVNGLLLGGWEPNGLSLDPRSYPITQKPPAIAEDWPVLSTLGI